MEFPLAERELTRRAVHRWSYWLRLAAPAFILLGSFFFWLYTLDAGGASGDSAAGLGRFFAFVAHFAQQCSAFLVCVLWAAPGIARERHDRTFDLLLCAGRSGSDIYIAKFFAAYMPAAMLLLSTLPLLAIASLLGGVSVSGAAIEVLSLLTGAAAATSLALLVSRHAATPNQAYPAAVVLVAVWLVGTEIVDIVSSSFWNWGLLRSLNELDQLWDDPARWVPGTLLACGITAVAMLSGSWKLSSLSNRAAISKKRRARRVRGRRDVADRIVTAGAGGLVSSARLAWLRVLLAVTLPIVAVLPCLGPPLIWAVTIYDVVVSVHTSRRSGAMEDLLMTPLSNQELSRAVLRANLKRCWVYLPALFIMSLFTTMFTISTGSFAGLSNVPESWMPLIFMASVFAWLVAASMATALKYAVLVALGCFCATLGDNSAGQSLLGVLMYGILTFLTFMVSTPLRMVSSTMFSIYGSIEAVAGLATGVMLFGVGLLLQWVAFMILYGGFQHRVARVLRSEGAPA